MPAECRLVGFTDRPIRIASLLPTASLRGPFRTQHRQAGEHFEQAVTLNRSNNLMNARSGKWLAAAVAALTMVSCVLCAAEKPSQPISDLRTEHLRDPLGIDVVRPRFSWSVNLTNRGARQTAYQILAASSEKLLSQNRGDLWDSGKATSSDPLLIEYAGRPLVAGELCYWKVRIWDQEGAVSDWSPAAFWSMGLLKRSDWTAKWIGMPTTNSSPAAPSPMLRKTFEVRKPVKRAMAYVCGLGYFEMLLNGTRVSDHVLQPTWTRYDLLADYVTFDVTTNLVRGRNAVGVQLGNGFYNQWARDAWNTSTAPWRAPPQLILQLDVEYADGTRDRVVTDETWRTSTGPIVLDAARMGEIYDARLEKPGWVMAGYDDSGWSGAVIREGVTNLLAPNSEPVRIVNTLRPVSISPVPGRTNTYLFDFGQNIAGWCRLSVQGPAGTAVRMVFGEETNRNGSVSQRRINVHVYSHKEFFQAETYILKGSGLETWEPRFTYHGFQYVQVEGLPSRPDAETLAARVLNTDFEQAGSFECSNEIMNRTETNTIRSFLGNFVGIPTDCPHREKNGWTGDAQLAAEVGLTHWRSAAAYGRWMREFRPGQKPNGKLAGVFPNAIWSYDRLDGPAWESAYLLIPWLIYQHCGDARVLTNNYEGMKAYVEHCRSIASNNIVSYGLGDWCPAKTETPAALTSTAYHFQNALILAETAALMGRTAESQQYSNLAEKIRVAFNERFYNRETKLYANGSQTAQSAALYFGLTDASEAVGVANALVENVRRSGHTVDTGILGSKYLLRALCDSGHPQAAMALAMQTNYPSWGHWLERSANTLWETWHGKGDIDSLNHIMFGDISAWFIQYVGGIRAGAPGYKTVLIKPEITGQLSWARASHNSPYGTITSAWKLQGGGGVLEVTIPPGTTALVYLPMGQRSERDWVVQESGATIWRNGAVVEKVPFVAVERTASDEGRRSSIWRVASGSYRFTWNFLSQTSAESE